MGCCCSQPSGEYKIVCTDTLPPSEGHVVTGQGDSASAVFGLSPTLPVIGDELSSPGSDADANALEEHPSVPYIDAERGDDAEEQLDHSFQDEEQTSEANDTFSPAVISTITADAADGGVIQIGPDHSVEIHEGFPFQQSKRKTEKQESKEGLHLKARGPGGPGIIQLGKGSKVVYKTKNKPKPPSVPEFRRKTNSAQLRKEIDDKEYLVPLEVVVRCGKSVGFLCWSHASGTAFRVGDKYVITAYHIIGKVLGTVPAAIAGNPEQAITSPDFYVDFDYRTDRRQPSTSQFNFLSICYANPDLDVAVLELNTEGRDLPQPLTCFTTISEHQRLTFIGHDNAKHKARDPNCQVIQPSEAEIMAASNWCVKQGFPENGYDTLRREGRIRFHCLFQKGASGSPGIFIHGNEGYVGAMLTRGYPSFYWNLSPERQRQFPPKLLLEEGIAMEAVFYDMQTKNPQLCTNIFRHV